MVPAVLRNRRQHEERAEVLLSRRANGMEMAKPAESATQLQLGRIPAAAALQSAAEAEVVSWLSETYEDVCLKSRMT